MMSVLDSAVTKISLLSLVASLKPVKALPAISNIDQSLHVSSSTSLTSHLPPLVNLNSSSSHQNYTLTLPANNNYLFTCSGESYGYFQRHEISDCLHATEAIATGRERYTFAMRGTPEYDEDAYPLPWRWMSRRSIFFLFSRTSNLSLCCLH